LVEFAVRAEARGKHVYYLNIGQPDVFSPPAFWAAVREADIKTLEYSHSAGILPLRQAMAVDYQRKGIPVDETDILVTNGGSEATLFAFLSCFDAGDDVIVVEPFYANYAGFAATAGVNLVPLTTKLDEDFALPSPEAIAGRLTPRTKGILLCNPSNPTGTVYAPAELESIARLARAHDLFLIVDEVYRDFYYGTEKLLSVFQIPGMESNAVMIDSVSKKFSLCGARIGFFITKNVALRDAALKYAQARLAAPTLDQLGVVRCLAETPASYFAEVREEYMARRDTLIDGLAKIPGVRCPKIEGAFYAVVGLPIDDADRFCEWLVSDFDLDGDTVLLAPASGFYVTSGLGRDEVRIAYVLNQEKLRRAIEVLGAALAVYPGVIRTPVVSST
jgi:aspartate aminotransferase